MSRIVRDPIGPKASKVLTDPRGNRGAAIKPEGKYTRKQKAWNAERHAEA